MKIFFNFFFREQQITDRKYLVAIGLLYKQDVSLAQHKSKLFCNRFSETSVVGFLFLSI